MDDVERLARVIQRADNEEAPDGTLFLDDVSCWSEHIAREVIAELDLPARDARIRAEALEEAAMVADNYGAGWFNEKTYAGQEIARTIRSLKDSD